jgi:hypothetical protein
VVVLVENIEHAEFYCGPGGCPSQPGVYWRAQYTTFPATVTSPGDTSTSWSTSFPTYDHPHSYKIAAWAIDDDGIADPSHASVPRICVGDPGLASCV